MSIPVSLDRIGAESADRPYAYLVTVTDAGRAHVVAVRPTVSGEAISVRGLGRRTAANLAARPDVTILWPPVSPDGYTLIVDGVGSPADDGCTVAPARGVLHRSGVPATDPAQGACGSDCVELTD